MTQYSHTCTLTPGHEGVAQERAHWSAKVTVITLRITLATREESGIDDTLGKLQAVVLTVEQGTLDTRRAILIAWDTAACGSQHHGTVHLSPVGTVTHKTHSYISL